MLNIDLEKAKELIKKETDSSESKALIMTEQLKKINPALSFVVTSWLDGNHINYSFEDISLFEIAKKKRCSFIQAVFTMSMLIDNPEFVEVFKETDFSRK